MRKTAIALTLGSAVAVGATLPVQLPWMPPVTPSPTAAPSLTPQASLTHAQTAGGQSPSLTPASASVAPTVAATGSTGSAVLTRWAARSDGWHAYNDYFGENNGCRNDFELSYGGIVKADKVTKLQARENELMPSSRYPGYVHLIESDAQEDGGC